MSIVLFINLKKLYYSRELSIKEINILEDQSSKGEEILQIERLKFLEKQLKEAKKIILEKEKKCNRLIQIQNLVDNEVQELTEALFQVFFYV